MSKTFTSIIIIVSILFIYSAKLSGRDVESHQPLSKSNSGKESYLDNKEQGNRMSFLENSTTSFNQEVYLLFEEALNTVHFSLSRFLKENKINLHENISEFAQALKNSSIVESLFCGDSTIDDNAAKAISEALKGKKNIYSIYLWNNNIGDEGAKALAELLNSNDSISTIKLSYNKIGSDGALYFANAIKLLNKKIMTFDISNNQIGDEGVEQLSQAFKNHESITYIYLGNNNITNKGALSIKHILESNINIRQIDLNHNLIDDEGALSIIDAIKPPNTRSIDLSFVKNKISEAGAKSIKEIIDYIDKDRSFMQVFL